MEEKGNSKTLVYLLGGIVGLLTGLTAAFLYLRAREQSGETPKLSSGQGVKLGLGIVSLLKQVSEIHLK